MVAWAGARRQRDRALRRPGLHQRRRVGDVADRDDGDVGRLARRATATGYAFRVRARDTQGQRSAPGTSTALGRHAVARASAGSGAVVARRPRLPRAARTRARPGSARSTAGTIVAITRGPVIVGRLHLVRGHRADPRVDARRRSSSAASGSPREVVSTTLVAPVRAPNTTSVDAGIRRPRLRGAGPATARRHRRRAARRPRLLAQRRRVRGRAPAPLDERVDARRLADAARAAAPTARSSARVACPTLGAGAQAWDWNGKVGGDARAATAATCSSSSGRRAAGRLPRAVGATRDDRAGRARTASRVDTVAPAVSVGVRRRATLISPERRRHPRLGPLSSWRRPAAPSAGRSLTTVGGRHRDPHGARDRRVRIVHVERRTNDGGARRRRPLHGHPRAHRRRRQHGAAFVRDDRRHDAPRSSRRGLARRVLAQRRRRRRCDPPVVDGAASAATRHGQACTRARPLVRSWTVSSRRAGAVSLERTHAPPAAARPRRHATRSGCG